MGKGEKGWRERKVGGRAGREGEKGGNSCSTHPKTCPCPAYPILLGGMGGGGPELEDTRGTPPGVDA